MSAILICAVIIGHFEGRMREEAKMGLNRVREVKNYKEWVIVNVIRLAESASWQH